MKFIVYSENVDRLNFWGSILKDKKQFDGIEIFCIDNLTSLSCYMDVFEYSLCGIILDLENVTDYFTLDYKLKSLHNNIDILSENTKTAVLTNKLLENKSLPYIENDFNICKRYTDFENLLFDLNNFLLQCKFLPKYKYKLAVKNEKCHLKEYFDNTLTGIKIPIISYKDNVLCIKINKNFSQKLVVSIVKRILSDETNIVNILGYVREVRFKCCDKTFTFVDSMSTKEMLECISK